MSSRGKNIFMESILLRVRISQNSCGDPRDFIVANIRKTGYFFYYWQYVNQGRFNLRIKLALPYKRFFFFLIVFWAIFLTGDFARGESESKGQDEKHWFASVYYGIYTPNVLLQGLLIFPVETEDLYFVGLGVGKELYRWRKSLTLEGEGIVAYHYGEIHNVIQHFGEFVASLNLRYRLPWDKYLITTFAAGEGLSYATESLEGEENRRLMNYLMFEATFAMAQYPDVNLVYRMHHRSGIWGGLGLGGSNYYTFGLRYRF
jgi:hypothetical protein